MKRNLLLWVIILVEGFVTISVEILAIRQLIPFVGSSVLVTSLIIGIFLLFLAVGYWVGGTVQNRYFEILARNYIIAAVFIGIGLSYWFCQIYFYVINEYLSHFVLVNLSIYLLMVLAPLVFFLGQTVPITTNLFSKRFSIGGISGRALFLSTVGSFLGAILTSLVLINYLGVAATLFINCVLLAGLSFLLISNYRLITILLLSLICYVIYELNVNYEKQIMVRTNSYANYQVANDVPLEKNNRAKVFLINNSLASLLTETNKPAKYIQTIQKILFDQLQLKGKQILVIGAGGFTLTHKGNYANTVTYLDIDKEIKTIASNYFLNAAITDPFISQDARLFFNVNRQHYDVIIGDAYNNRNAIPESLLTQQYFNQIKQALKPGGIALFNIIASATFDDAFSQRIDNTLQSVFNHCRSIPLNFQTQHTNIIYLCVKSQSDNSIYTDNLNSATIDYFKNETNY